MGNLFLSGVDIDGVVTGITLGALGKAGTEDRFAVVAGIDGRRAAAQNPVIPLVILPARPDRQRTAVMVGIQPVGEITFDGVVVQVRFVGVVNLDSGDPS